ncbi:SDR family NAD(P)-dependent oxidoreductase [Microcoleus sp. A003_D6]|uniref:SDR family NAD(P)-dependent oxidoreductase n=1 Tax=Microcoleus sp. A003_D6 TaxID=3055266 RepID=UPI002FD5853D
MDQKNLTERQYQTIVRHEDPVVGDHRVFDVRILPGVCLVDLICRIAVSRGIDLSEIEVRNILFIEPVATTESFDRRLRISFRSMGEESDVTVESQAEKDGKALEEEWRVHARCKVIRVSSGAPPALNEEARSVSGDRVVLQASSMYEVARTAGIVHGEFYQPLGLLHRKPRAVVAQFHLSEVSQSYESDFLIHPAYLDGSTLVPFFLNEEETERLAGSPYVPFYIESFRIWKRGPQTCYVFVPMPDLDAASSSTVSEAFSRDIFLFDGDGNPVAAMHNCLLKRIRDASAISRLTELKREAPTQIMPQPLEQTNPYGDWTDYLRHRVAELVGKQTTQIPEQTGFYDLGLDSTQLLQLAHTIEQQTGKEIYPTLLFEYPNIEALAGYLGEHFGRMSLLVSEQAAENELSDEPVNCVPALRVFDWEPYRGAGRKSADSIAPLLVFARPEQWMRLRNTPAFDATNRLVLWAEPGPRFVAIGEGHYQVNPARRIDFDKFLAVAGALKQLHIVHLWNHDIPTSEMPGSLSDWMVTGFESLVLLEQSILAMRPVPRVTVLYGADPDGPPQETAIAAHFRTVAIEYPSLAGRVIEVGSADLANAVLEEFQFGEADQPFEVRYQAGIRLCRNARILSEGDGQVGDIQIRPDAVYWIAGGGSGLGLLFAQRFVEAGARVLITARSPASAELQRELDTFAKSLVYRQVDVTDSSALQTCLSETQESLGPIRGIIHAAGIKEDRILGNKDLASIGRVLAPKLIGTLQLDAVTSNQPLDFFVLFSSISAMVGNIGQSDYAYANGFLDRFAEHREQLRAKGLRKGRTISIAWPPWTSGGMKISPDKQREIRKRHGLEVLQTEAGIQALERILRCPEAHGQVVVWSGAIADAESVAGQMPRSRIEGTSGKDPEPMPRSRIKSTGNKDPEPIAIIGVNGRFPKATNLREFWRNLEAGRDCITEVPAGRWQNESGGLVTPGRQWGGFIDDFDCFDPLFFQISPRDARLMDPQERLFLEVAWAALEDAGYCRDRLKELHSERSGGGVGVFAGVMWNEYQLFRQQTGMLPASWSFSVANRVSHFFDFHGPSVTLDTACSSSLLAIHMACESIRRGDCSLALAGGVNLSLHPDKYQLLGQMQMLSRSGRCRSFGAGADGYVAGEGVGAVVLCSLAQALENDDTIYGVIRGSATNHNGRTGGYTVPHPGFQARAIEEALRRAGVSARQVSHIEAHGTGTALGDPIEIAGLTAAFSRYTADRGFCTVSSVKSNIGHLEAAAGVAALIKVLLEMRHKTLVPSLHCLETNPEIRFDSTPFYLQRETAPWEVEGERIAGISSFGAGGVNVHLIVSEPPVSSISSIRREEGTHEIVLSARTPEALRRYATAMAEALTSSDVTLANLAFTLQSRREWMEEKIRFAASSIVECRERLEAIAQNESLPLWNGEIAEIPKATGTHVTGLPTYPFERQRYWVAETPSVQEDTNRRTATFTEKDQMLQDHRVDSRMVVPGGAFLTMLFAAVGKGTSQQWSGLTFLEPAIVSKEPLEATVALANQVPEGLVYHIVGADGRQFCRATCVGDSARTSPIPDIDKTLGVKDSSAIELDTIEIDRLFSRRGIEYGPSCRLLESIRVEESQALGKLRAAGGEDWAIIDAALQVTGALFVDSGNQLFVPYSVNWLWLDGELASVRYIRAHRIAQTAESARFDISATDSQGAVILQLDGVCLMTERWKSGSPDLQSISLPAAELVSPEDRLRYFQPVWRSLPQQRIAFPAVSGQGGVAIVSAVGSIPDCVREAASIAHGAIAESLDESKPSAVWYLADTGDNAAIGLFRLILNLRKLVPAPEPLELRVLTLDAGAVSKTDVPVPGSASVAGLARTIAAENPHWRVCCLDVSSQWLQTGKAQILVDAFGEALGDSRRFRELSLDKNGIRERVLEAVEVPQRQVTLRRGGVYAIAGGAGGIGAALAEHFASKTSVCLVLLGRRPIDATIRTLLKRLEQAGSEAIYLSGDITNLSETARMFEEARSRFGSIHGVVHSALVLRDGSLTNLTEADFLAAFEVKVAGTISIDRATRQDKLDFLAFFSSLNSFAGNPGQGNYVAGCAYQDAYAVLMRRERPEVRIFTCNWGYWGETGIVASPEYRARLKRQGIGSISTTEGLAAFDRMLSSDLAQVAIFKATDSLCSSLGCVESINTVSGDAIEGFHKGFESLELLAASGLARVLREVGESEVAPRFRRLRAAILTSSKAAATSGIDESALRRDALEEPGTASWLRLLDRCLNQCAAVMRAQVSATEVLFPDGSAELVEAVYQGNPPADRFSQLVAEAISLRSRNNKGATLRVLEIGAGTGASTKAILEKMGPETGGLEYWFTDLSPTLVRAAANRFGGTYPFLKFSTLDIERPEGFGLPTSFDAIAASNVIHATRDIRRSLANIHRLLKPGGLLLLNELTKVSNVLTATFGLTDGWWSFEDEPERLPGSPLLSSSRWKALLEETGFSLVDTTESEDCHTYRQALFQAVRPAGVRSASRPWEDRIRELVSECLQIPTARIDDDRRFAEYGLDSISAVDLIRGINRVLSLNLRTTVLFDYPSVSSLAKHLNEEHRPHTVDTEDLRTCEPVPASAPVEPDFPSAVLLTSPSSVAELQLQTRTVELPEAGKVQIAVQACSLNFGDLLCIKGLYPTMPPYPFTPGFEVSGRVISVGEGVEGFQPGDEVVSILGESMGGLSEVVNAEAWLTVRKPAHVPHEMAAAFPVAWLTAHCALGRANLRPGERILIQTAAGGTGLHAVRMALEVGAEVFATAGSERKLDYLKSIGVHHTIAYRETDFRDEVFRLTENRGVDVVLNTLSGDALQKGIEVLAPGGRYVELAMTAWKSGSSLDLSRLVDNQTILSLDLRRLLMRRSPETREYLDQMVAALDRGAGEGMVDRVFPLSQIRNAFQYLESRENIGKIVISMGRGVEAIANPELAQSVPTSQIRANRDLSEAIANPESARSLPTGNIAIVGMSGRFPGAQNIEQFWSNLQSGISSCGAVPKERWEPETLSQETGDADYTRYCQFGAFLDEVHEWDSLFFRITGAEAQFMSPEQRLFLEEAWKAIEDAGIPDRELDGAACGVFAAASAGDYAEWLEQSGMALDGHILTGNHSAILSARLSYLLNLKGPSITVDTACSSSLVAIDLACRSLLSGQCSTAIAGGAFIMNTPRFHLLCGKAGMLSPSGKLRAFSAGADGFVPGEGVGVLVLKRLEDAMQNNDRIHGVIRGIAVNQDGQSNGITAPSSLSQSALEREVYAVSGIDPATITMVEAHGTGTALGDPIEVEAIARAFREKTSRTGFCAIGSVKTNIGHTVYAAGVAAVIKVLLCFRHRQLPPSLHFERANPQISFELTPFYVNNELRPWQAPVGTPLRATVSSFGFSGTNCHAVLEEPPSPTLAAVPSASEPELFLVSAKSKEALQDRLADLVRFLDANPMVSLREFAATLATRRSHFQYRVAFVADSADLLRQQFLGGAIDTPIEWSQGQPGELVRKAAIAIGVQRKNLLLDLTSAYEASAAVEWELLYPKNQARPLSLPHYPFRPVRCSPLPSGLTPEVSLTNGDAPVEIVRGLLADALAIPREKLNLLDPWDSLGLDSLLIKKLNALLSERFGPLPSSLFFEQRNLNELVQFLLKERPEMLSGTAVAPQASIHPAPTPCAPVEIAIVGLAGRYPGAKNIDEFWQLLMSGVDAIREVPDERWDHKLIYDPDRGNPTSSYTKWGGFLEDADKFDPLFFGISPKEAELMDPQERIFLEVCWQALEDAAYTPSGLSAGRVDLGVKAGVFVGVTWGSYQLLAAEEWARGRVVIPGASHWTVANRVSHVLNWSGPSMTVDTACSSSLVAVHLACEAIHRRECDLALAGGVNLYLHPSKYVGLSQQQFASSDGRCRSFGIGGDGYVPGEGAGAVVLKPLAQAVSDGDRIYGVIRGSSVNHGGRTHGYSVPNPAAQAAAIERALEQSGFGADSLSYVEAHGTGTELGDPLEIVALSRVFGGRREIGEPCAIGSVKSNIGHLESAAGIAGLTKVLLQMKYGKLVPSLHAETPNPSILFENTCFRLQRDLTDWTPGSGLRRAGLSSFGAGGANAHVILEEFVSDTDAPVVRQQKPELIPISAANEERLRFLASAIADAIKAEPDTDIASVAATLQRGREPMAYRLAIVADSTALLLDSLRDWLAGTPDTRTFAGKLSTRQVQAPPALLRQICPQTQQMIDRGDLLSAARRWADGADVNWKASGAIVSLPGYPFLRERYWLPAGEPMRGCASSVPLKPPSERSHGMLLARRVWREVPANPYDGGSLILSGLGISSQEWIELLQQMQPGINISVGWPDSDPAPLAVVRVWHFCDSPQEQEGALLELLKLCRAILRQGDRAVELIAVATGANSTMQAAFLRTLVAEYPNVAAASLAVDELAFAPTSLLPLCVRIPALQAGQAKELSVRNGIFQERFSEELPEQDEPAKTASAKFRSQGVYLISGGAGGIGRILARHLATKFHAKVALLGRKRFGPESVRLIQEIRELGGEAIYVCADITSAADVKEAVRRTRHRFGAIHGAIHAGGILEDCYISRKEDESFLRVLAPKVEGTLLLERATRNDDLDFFLLFSSLAAVVGNPGQSDYAAANAFLDQFAEHRVGRTLSINWSLWQEGGMQMPADMLSDIFEQTGMVPLPSGEGLDLIEKLLALGETSVIATWGDTARLRKFLGVMERSPRISLEPIESLLRELFGKELKIDPERIDPTAGLDVYGIDSVSIRRITLQLEEQFGTLPKTLLFHHKTIRELAVYLTKPSQVTIPASSSPEPIAANPNNDDNDDTIAIIGVNGRFPGADSLDELWELLRDGRESIREVPPDRWDHSLFYDPQPGNPLKTYARWGGFLNDVDRFDPLFFGITPKDAELIDPQERLFLESAWLALEDAGYQADSLRCGRNGQSQQTGVFAGVTWGSYQLFGADAWGRGHAVFPNSSFWSVANRVSYTLDLHGPSIPVDTACSASLSAIHLACESLRRGECDVAIAGGVNLYLHPSKFVQMAQLRFASTDGKCRSFGAGGDGYVPGEGVGVVILKRLSAAKRDRDHIYATILGSAMNHGGKTNGYTVPNPSAQAEVVRLALERSGIAPNTISYIEAHGTGTALGDPIEIDGLRAAFETSPEIGKGICAIGSIKSNIGHLESAAGVAGLFKILLQMKHRLLVPSLHGEIPNPAIDFESSPFRLQKVCATWESEGLRRAGISSFGAGGSNAHAIVEEYQSPWRPESEIAPELVVLSARNERLLRIAARNLAQHLSREPGIRLADVAFTLQIGRRASEHRLALYAVSIDQVRSLLNLYLQGGKADDLFLGVANSCKVEIEAPTLGDLRELATHWVTGGAVQWENLHRLTEPWRVSLPGSPFDRRRCWIEMPDETLVKQRVVEELVYRDDPIVREHRINDVPTLPGATLLEIVGRAMKNAGFGVATSFKDVNWMRRAEIHADSMRLLVSLSLEQNGVRFAIRNTTGDTYASGRSIRSVEALGPQAVPASFADLLEPGGRVISQELYYEAFEQVGVTYGPLFRGIREVRLLACGASALFDIEGLEPTLFGGQSVVLDAAFQTVQAQLQRDGRKASLWLPLSVESVQIFSTLPLNGTILLQRSDPNPPNVEGIDIPIARFQLVILDDIGRMVAIVENFCVKLVKTVKADKPQKEELEQWLLPVLEGLARGDRAVEETDRLLQDISIIATGRGDKDEQI